MSVSATDSSHSGADLREGAAKTAQPASLRDSQNRRVRIRLSHVALVFYLFISAYKGVDNPSILGWAVNPTSAAAILAALACAGVIVKDSLRVPRMKLIVVLPLLALLPSLLLADFSLAFTVDKAVYFFVATGAAIFFAAVTIRTPEDIVSFTRVVFIAGCIVAFDAGIRMVSGSGGPNQLIAFNSDPIALARSVSLTIIFLTGYAFVRHGLAKYCLPVIGIQVLILVGSGERAPLILILPSIIIIYLLTRRHATEWQGRKFHGWPMVATVGCVILFMGLALTWGHSIIPTASSQRLLLLIQEGTFKDGVTVRTQLIMPSVPLIWENPLGVGFGNYQSYIGHYYKGVTFSYPHNILVEVAVEAGLIPAGLFIFYLFYSFRRALQVVRAYPERADISIAAMMFLFSFLVTLFSGHLGSHRILFVFATAFISVAANLKTSGADDGARILLAQSVGNRPIRSY